MTNDAFFLLIAAGVIYALGFMSGRAGLNAQRQAEMQRREEELRIMRHESNESSGSFTLILLFLLIVFMAAAAMVLNTGG